MIDDITLTHIEFGLKTGYPPAIEKYTAEIDAIVAEPQEYDPEFLSKLGAYLYHEKIEPLKAISILEVAHHKLRGSEKSYDAGNHLAAAIIAAFTKGEFKDPAIFIQRLGKASELITATERDCQNNEIVSFALRTKGQMLFFLARTSSRPNEKLQYLDKGIAFSLEGIDKLDLRDTKQLPEAARAYTRLAAELVSYSKNQKSETTAEPDKLPISRAVMYAQGALELWETIAPSLFLIKSRAETNFILGEVYAEKSRLDGVNRKPLEKAREHFTKARELLSGSGNQKSFSEARGKELELLGQLKLMPAGTRRAGF